MSVHGRRIIEAWLRGRLLILWLASHRGHAIHRVARLLKRLLGRHGRHTRLCSTRLLLILLLPMWRRTRLRARLLRVLLLSSCLLRIWLVTSWGSAWLRTRLLLVLLLVRLLGRRWLLIRQLAIWSSAWLPTRLLILRTAHGRLARCSIRNLRIVWRGSRWGHALPACEWLCILLRRRLAPLTRCRPHARHLAADCALLIPSHRHLRNTSHGATHHWSTIRCRLLLIFFMPGIGVRIVWWRILRPHHDVTMLVTGTVREARLGHRCFRLLVEKQRRHD